MKTYNLEGFVRLYSKPREVLRKDLDENLYALVAVDSENIYPIKMGFEKLNRELRIRTDNVLAQAIRNDVLELVVGRKSKEELESAASRVKCWVCMDKGLVWGNRGWGAHLDGKGGYDLLTCGNCTGDGDEHKWNQCCSWSFIEGSKYCAKDDYASDDKQSVNRLLILAERA